jgi:hypothetical protein
MDPLTRRGFVARSFRAGLGVAGIAAGAGTILTLLAGCGSQDEVGENVVVTSSPDVTAHDHQLTIPAADINNSPSSRQYSASITLGHIHTISLQQADFEAIAGGGAVTKTSSSDGVPLHSHQFVIKTP